MSSPSTPRSPTSPVLSPCTEESSYEGGLEVATTRPKGLRLRELYLTPFVLYPPRDPLVAQKEFKSKQASSVAPDFGGTIARLNLGFDKVEVVLCVDDGLTYLYPQGLPVSGLVRAITDGGRVVLTRGAIRQALRVYHSLPDRPLIGPCQEIVLAPYNHCHHQFYQVNIYHLPSFQPFSPHSLSYFLTLHTRYCEVKQHLPHLSSLLTYIEAYSYCVLPQEEYLTCYHFTEDAGSSFLPIEKKQDLPSQQVRINNYYLTRTVSRGTLPYHLWPLKQF